MAIRPYGTWPSALGADLVARASSRRFGHVDVDAGRVRWTEARAGEGGRTVVVEARAGGAVVDLTPPGANARTRAHEYGGGAVWYHGDTVFYSDFADGRLYRLDGPARSRGRSRPSRRCRTRCATPTASSRPTARRSICVRERHDGRRGARTSSSRSPPTARPSRACSPPATTSSWRRALDPTGRRLAWLGWDHPRMPWDGTELWVAELGALGRRSSSRAASDESVIDPQWSPDGDLHYCSDRTGWWNLYARRRQR